MFQRLIELYNFMLTGRYRIIHYIERVLVELIRVIMCVLLVLQ